MKSKTCIIGICGGSGSGKTTVTSTLVNLVGEENVSIIEQDSYYKDQSHLGFEDRVKTNYDHPFAFDNKLLIQQIKDLKEGKAIENLYMIFLNITGRKKH